MTCPTAKYMELPQFFESKTEVDCWSEFRKRVQQLCVLLTKSRFKNAPTLPEPSDRRAQHNRVCVKRESYLACQ